MANHILEYYQQIRDGSVTVCKWTRLAYEMLVHGIEAHEWRFDQKKAALAVAFIENFAHHHEGAMAPQKFKLELWQKALVSAIFGIVDDESLRQFREIFVVVARKNAKSLLASAIAEYMTFADGEYGGQIYFAAPKLQQAQICYHGLIESIRHEPMLEKISRKRRTDLYVEETNTTAAPLAFSAKKSDGFNVSLGVLDEVASWPAEQGLKFYEVLKSSQGARRQPMLLSISTAGYISDGIYDELMKRSTRVLLGDSRERRLLPVLYMIEDLEKWNDISELAKSNPNLGASVSVDYLLDEVAIAEGSLSKKSEFLTKYGNVKQSSSQAWLPAQTVMAATGEPLDLADFRECYCVAGIDLSQTRDLTSACVVIERDGVLNVISKFWMPAGRIEEATERDGVPYDIYRQRGFLELAGDQYVDYTAVREWFFELVRKWHVYPLMTGYDRYSAQYLIQDLKAGSFQVDDVYQGENLYGVIQETEGLFAEGRFRIGDNDLLKIHLLDSAVKMSAERGRGKLVKLSPTVHIDGTAALLDAMTVRQKYHDQFGAQLQNIRRGNNGTV